MYHDIPVCKTERRGERYMTTGKEKGVCGVACATSNVSISRRQLTVRTRVARYGRKFVDKVVRDVSRSVKTRLVLSRGSALIIFLTEDETRGRSESHDL